MDHRNRWKAGANGIATAIFDWDGTLLDSAALGFLAFERTFRDLDVAFNPEVYKEIYSPNWYRMYEALAIPREKWPLADSLWLQHYGETSPCLVDGARAAVLALCRKGYRLGVVSSGSASRVRREVECVGFERIFQVVLCNEDTTQKKPHPEGLERAMAHLNTVPSSSCYIGDSPEDIEMGRRAGMLTIGIPGSYPGGKRILAAKPDICLDSIQDLLHFL